MIKVSEYFNNDLIDYAAYDNIRKIPSYIDGMKMSQRKVIYTLIKKYPKDFVKTETLANVAAAYTNYLHGANNLSVVCATMTQPFTGANNYTLTNGNSGGWGCRINPTVAAPRYTRLQLSSITKGALLEDDEEIIGRQFFEGDYIEPKFFVPVFPLLFLNGSNGLSTGFSCTIYPRNPDDIITYIKKRLSGVKSPKVELVPWFRGFKGEIKKNPENGTYESVGIVKKINATKYEITELPVGMEYQKYVSILDKLCEDKIINDYDDCCDPKTDSILFVLKTTRQFTNKYSDIDALVKLLKLSKTLPENLNCIDENNRVREFSSVEEIIDAYIDVRLAFYEKRKEYLIEKLKNRLIVLASKYLFCKGVISNTIKIAKQSKANIIAQLEKIEKIHKQDDSYDYLLRMPIHSISKETMESLSAEIDELKQLLRELVGKSLEDMWNEDLKAFKKTL